MARPTATTFLCVIGVSLVLQLACGSTASPDGGDAGAGGAASGGASSGGAASGGSTASGGTASGGSTATGGSTGTGGSTATGGSTGSGGSSSAGCPGAPPEDGTVTCAGFGSCFYEDCEGEGQVAATCDGDVYQVETSACADFDCGSETCTSGQICVVNAGGAFIGTCVDNPCGDGAVTCECGRPDCPGACNVYGTPGYGIEVTCTACPNGQPCP